MSEHETMLEVATLSSIGDVPGEVWDLCAGARTAPGERPQDPFTTHRFLSALEESGSVGEGTGWIPHHLQVRANGETIAVAPMYAKLHSQGEYIFDHTWAHAYENAGGEYYPKLQLAVPHTPATGRRFLTQPGYEQMGTAALIQGATEIAAKHGLSSVHVTFCTAHEAAAGAQMGLRQRTSQQFHWENPGYTSFEDFTRALSSSKRKNIRKERTKAQNFGGEFHILTGDDIKAEHWDAFWLFYQDTGARKWGTPYLTRAFFDCAHATLRDDILLVLARHNGEWIAGALNFIGRETLFGRYWGCLRHHDSLHFEMCYYQAMDFAIAHGLRIEAGAQGEHKLARGYLPRRCHSLHWFADERFGAAVGEYLEAEGRAIDHEIEVLTAYGPFRAVDVNEQD